MRDVNLYVKLWLKMRKMDQVKTLNMATFGLLDEDIS